MCTAITFNNGDCYFGRTLDLEYNYNEEIVIAPRNFPFKFRQERPLTSHHSIVGIATVSDGYPLFYDAVNEFGLCAAALNFPSESVFFERKPDAVNLASFELIQWLLGKFSNVKEVYQALCNVNITNDSFDEDFSATPLHWMVSDKNGSIVIESISEGLKVHENPIGVLTNSPQFPWHMTNLSNYMNLTSTVPQNRFTSDVSIEPYSKGLGAYGLPGDGSSASRFVRTAFIKFNSVSGTSEEENVSRFFHIMDSVSQTKGCIRLDENKHFYTVYTSCYNADKGIFYYTTYENRSVNAIDMNREDLDSTELIRYPMLKSNQINIQNKK